MDVNVDQGAFHGDMGKTSEGKYLYKLDPTKFDIDKFNRDFEQYNDQRKESMQEAINVRLAALNTVQDPTLVYNLSIGEIAVNTKDSLFNTLDDVLHKPITSQTFLQKNRLFYIGLTFIFLSLIVFFYAFFVQST
jgi:hypothetical protein